VLCVPMLSLYLCLGWHYSSRESDHIIKGTADTFVVLLRLRNDYGVESVKY
jgi:hypothetical protein